MIYFFTDWQLKIENCEMNALLSLITTFHKSNIKTKNINMNISPFLNYFSNQFEFNIDSSMTGLFDTICKEKHLNHTPVTMNDLHFPEDYEKTYTPEYVLLSVNGLIKNKVYFNTFGFVSKVDYFFETGKESHIYSEQGFILSKILFNNCGNETNKQIFDKLGRVILTESLGNVKIGFEYSKYFKKSEYENFTLVCTEVINNLLENFDPKEDHVILDGTSNWLMELSETFKYPERIIYVFSGNDQDSIEQIDTHIELISKKGQVVTDNPMLKSTIDNNNYYQSIKNSVRQIPLFPTKLNLGESSTYSEQYIYWQIDQFNVDVLNLLSEFLYKKSDIKELNIMIDSLHSEDELEINKFIESFSSKYFNVNLGSSTFSLVKKYYEALHSKNMTAELREKFNLYQKSDINFHKFVEAYKLIKSVTFRNSPSTQTLKNDFHKVRVFVDQRTQKNFFVHSLVASAGIPIISDHSSPYLVDQKNGKILEHKDNLVDIIEDYIQNTDKWNQSLVDNIDVIQNCSINGLMTKWKGELI